MRNNIVIRDDSMNKIMLGKQWHNGDWNLRFVTKVTYLEEYLPEEDLKNSGKYEIEILAVSPEAAGQENLKSAMDSQCLDEDQIKLIPYIKYESLIEYGITATLWYKQGNNLKQLLTEANKELQIIGIMFGFYMDKPANRIGNTGWDFISGNIGYK